MPSSLQLSFNGVVKENTGEVLILMDTQMDQSLPVGQLFNSNSPKIDEEILSPGVSS